MKKVILLTLVLICVGKLSSQNIYKKNIVGIYQTGFVEATAGGEGDYKYFDRGSVFGLKYIRNNVYKSLKLGADFKIVKITPYREELSSAKFMSIPVYMRYGDVFYVRLGAVFNTPLTDDLDFGVGALLALGLSIPIYKQLHIYGEICSLTGYKGNRIKEYGGNVAFMTLGFEYSF